MNRRRNASRNFGFLFLSLLVGAAITTAGGMLFGFYKNRQIHINDEIAAVNIRIEHDRLEIRTIEMRMDQLLNRFVIRKQLEDNCSTMRPISVACVEEIEFTPANRRTVASATP